MAQANANFSPKLVTFFDKYSIVVGALFIYGYYLFVSLDLFSAVQTKTGLLDLVFQFDSLLLMWGLVYLLVHLQRYHKAKREEEERQKKLLLELERQRLELSTLDEITEVLNDKINNPLSIISISTGSIRERLQADNELVNDIDRMESALRRVQEVMVSLQTYQTKKVMKISRAFEKSQPKDEAFPLPTS
jgi:hypothetical protein